MSIAEVQCPNPACTGRSVQGQEVIREWWCAIWHEATLHEPGQTGQPAEWASNITCPSCGTEGIDPESGQLDSAEEELGVRCEACGVVSMDQTLADNFYRCPYCDSAIEVNLA